MEQDASRYYHTKLALCDQQIARYERLINIYSFFRLIAFIAGIILIYQSLKLNRIWATELVFLLAVIGFGYLVKRQSVLEKGKTYFSNLKKVNANEINSMNRLENIYSEGSVWMDGLHPYTSDLDIFGKGSLFALMNRCSTALGNKKLADWLSGPAPLHEIRQRQEALKEISKNRDWKLNFQAALLFLNKGEDHAQKLFAYLRLTPGEHSTTLRIYIQWVPWIFIALAVLTYYVPWFSLILIIMGVTNALLSLVYNARVMKTADLTSKTSTGLARFHEAIVAINTRNWESPLCASLANDLKDGTKGKFADQVKHLSVLIARMDLLMIGFIGPILYLTTAWGIRQFLAMEDWKRNNRLNLEVAFDHLATFEALISISSLQTNYPTWCYPDIAEDENYTLTAQAIGHPLIPASVRIENDFSLNNELKIDIITGSNMAGKSTFLRTLGINAVLALSGAPVCAQKMRLTPMLIFSYMRITDSLNESTSTFKAELDRLRLLLETLKTNQKVYFLIDEMLRGTNSVDKYRGSKAVIEKLIGQKAVGIVATHDLQIAQLEQKYPDYIRNFYFDIRVEGEEMKFDYTLKYGECKTFNASLLLRQLGIEVDDINNV